MSQGEGQEAVLWKVVLLPALPAATAATKHHEEVYLPGLAVQLKVPQQDLLIVQICHQMESTTLILEVHHL
jgi:hypothetical protein